MPNFYPAKVIDNNDLEKRGRVQIRIEHLHGEITDNTLLPWAKQASLSTGGASTYGVSSIPEIGSWVWVFFDNEELLNIPFYFADVQLNGMHPHELFEDNIKTALGASSVYPDMKYLYLANGICIGVSSGSAKEVFIYHPAGSHIFINNAGEIHLKAGTVAVEKVVLGETTQQLLSDILDAIIAHTHATAGTGTPSAPVNVATFNTLKSTNLPAILSAKVKSN